MKLSYKLLMFIFMSFILIRCIFSWDSTAAKFYPLAVGNLWSYHHTNRSGWMCIVFVSEYDKIIRIVSDTLLPNGKRYFKFSNGNLERIDSTNMNVYRYYNESERIIDSLLARKNDYFSSFRSSMLATHKVNDTIPIIFSGTSRRGKQIRGNDLIGHQYALVENLGLFSESYCEFGGSFETLNGCIINGIQYGQIVGIEQNGKDLPVEFSLSQNYPNPFNPVTKIKFQIPAAPLSSIGEGSGVRLIVYDILGREIATLVNEQLKPGTYEVEWSATGGGSNYSTGVYFYKLIISDASSPQANPLSILFSETRKMVLIK